MPEMLKRWKSMGKRPKPEKGFAAVVSGAVVVLAVEVVVVSGTVVVAVLVAAVDEAEVVVAAPMGEESLPARNPTSSPRLKMTRLKWLRVQPRLLL